MTEQQATETAPRPPVIAKGLRDIAELIDYPAVWDTEQYPTLACAAHAFITNAMER